jgi:hypothetical protein
MYDLVDLHEVDMGHIRCQIDRLGAAACNESRRGARP